MPAAPQKLPGSTLHICLLPRSLIKALRVDVRGLLPPMYKQLALNSLVSCLTLNNLIGVTQGGQGQGAEQGLQERIRRVPHECRRIYWGSGTRPARG